MNQTADAAPMETMMTIRQVADFLHVNISTVRRWSANRILRSYRVGPRGDRRFLGGDVLSFLEQSASHSKVNIAGEEVPAGHERGGSVPGAWR